ncbi:50S ribosomal protein L9 [Candidatus Acetothermia bacterium]|nr:50S ribosomal protein L9 [Candidatus Acetothermia bacterium]MCI2427439.1 50S ribosomal protein L9 [Candidatus Acetothermia bacterium]MCI2428510.1 50S ribosomal protein L9 [Candidatus Acetothermia bacterium]
MIQIRRLLLITEVDHLGVPGDIVEVADGYARNYLLPQRRAVEPTEHNIARYAKVKREYESKAAERKEEALRIREEINDRLLLFTRKADNEGHLYGSVRAEDIAALIEEELKVTVERTRINLERPIETAGSYAIKIRLYEDITATVKVQVDAETHSSP